MAFAVPWPRHLEARTAMRNYDCTAGRTDGRRPHRSHIASSLAVSSSRTRRQVIQVSHLAAAPLLAEVGVSRCGAWQEEHELDLSDEATRPVTTAEGPVPRGSDFVMCRVAPESPSGSVCPTAIWHRAPATGVLLRSSSSAAKDDAQLRATRAGDGKLGAYRR